MIIYIAGFLTLIILIIVLVKIFANKKEKETNADVWDSDDRYDVTDTGSRQRSHSAPKEDDTCENDSDGGDGSDGGEDLYFLILRRMAKVDVRA